MLSALAVAKWYVMGWKTPQHDLAGTRWRTGAIPDAPVELGMRRPTEAIDIELMQRRLARDKQLLSAMLRQAMADEPIIEKALDSWCSKLSEESGTGPPMSV